MPSDDFVALMIPHKASFRRLIFRAVCFKKCDWHRVLSWIVHDLTLAVLELDNPKLSHEEGPWRLITKMGNASGVNHGFPKARRILKKGSKNR